MATPREINRADYRYCPECKEVIGKKNVKLHEGFFADEKPVYLCPQGHATEPLETPAPAPAPPAPAPPGAPNA